MQSILTPVENLRKNPKNPRIIKDKQFKKLVNSIKSFPEMLEIRPIVANSDGIILGGNMRFEACKAAGLKEVPVVFVGNLSKRQQEEFIIKDNVSGGEWNWEQLANEWDLKKLSEWGLDCPEIKNTDNDTSELIPEEQSSVEGICALGDLWSMGEHRLLCGDSTGISNVEKVLCGNDWDVLVFDPPYEIEELYQSAMLPFQENKKLLVFWDFKRFAIAGKWPIEFGWTPQYEFIWDCVTSWYTPNRPLARHKACGYFAKDPYFNFDKAIIHDGKERKAGIVKNTRGECDYKPLDGAVHIRTVESFPNASEGDVHKHGKPVQWITAIFNGIGGEKYLDLFGGGGTTLCVCESLGKKSYTIELNPESCNAIISRWEKMTGKKAELLNRNV